MSLSWTEHPLEPVPTPEQVKAANTPAALKALAKWHDAREQRILDAEEDPLRHGYLLEQQQDLEEMLADKTEVWVFGGNRCLAPEQPIEVNGVLQPIASVKDRFLTRALDEDTGKEVPAAASRPFRKPPQELYRYWLSDGSHIDCSQNHRVLANGQWLPMSELSETQWPSVFLTSEENADCEQLPLFDGDHLLTILDIDLLGSPPDARSLWSTVAGSLSCYRLFFRFGDEPLREVQGISRGVLPSLDDVLVRTSSTFCGLDDLGCKPLYTRLYLLCDRPSTLDGLRQLVDQCVDIEYRASCKPCRSDAPSPEYPESFEAPRQSIAESFRRLRSTRGFGRLGIGSYYVSASGDNLEFSAPVVKSDYLRKDVVYDFEVPRYHNYFIGNTVSHNSGKSYTAARLVMKALLENPGTTIICWSQNEEASVEMQQPYLWMMLPRELKKKVHNQTASINWNEKSGFTGKKFVLPNGSKCLFRFYSQFEKNPKVIEGYRVGLAPQKCGFHNIGSWLDEYYGDEELIGRIRRRSGDYNGKIIVSFTPLDGHTPTVDSIIKGAAITKTKYASLLKKEMPYVMEPVMENIGVMFFHTERNPFTNWKRIQQDLANRPSDEIKTVAYGFPIKSVTTLFPTFNPEVNVLSPKNFPNVFSGRFTRYMVIDPANARNYFALWAAVSERGEVYIYREWPDRETYGPWALFGDPRWKPGPASTKIGYNVAGYVDLFMGLERDYESIFERYVDSRFASQTDSSGRDLFTDFSDENFFVLPTDGQTEEKGLTRLDDWFSYNVNESVDNANRPLCYIHQRCGNLIDSLINYGAQGKADEALKDPIDCLRYLRMANHGDGIDYVNEERSMVTFQGGGGY